ncbi:hypothetical protein [Roseibium aggregatum]|uniref:hypothetical protein n=1 Tax=Roseibium aggregatum TaxID=187304 RepID=UPI001E42A079|nr:hypothetical protein [Roseibium aggregatum]UES36691.1 hypothetical protein GFC08_01810 [Roseibium aggregatum]
MNHIYDPKEMERMAVARESFSGRLLTDSQFDEAIAITGIIEREINKSGAFKEKLQDYSFAYARTEKFDQMKAETIVRDLFKARTGMTMNQMREKLKSNEEALSQQQKQTAFGYARDVEAMVRDGHKMSFYRASAHQAQQMAVNLNITELSAKRLISEAFSVQNGRDFYEWGKDLDTQYYRPQIEAEKQRSQQPRQQSLSLSR